MNLITAIKTQHELESFRDHVAQIRKGDNQPLRKGKLEHHVAKILGVADWNTALGMVAKVEAQRHVCHTCGFKLDPRGLCSYDQCFHYFWPQTVSADHVLMHQDVQPKSIDIDNGSGGLVTVYKRVEVEAELETDDRRVSTRFDASPYFHSILEECGLDFLGKQIAKIVDEQGSGCEATDDIAADFRDSSLLQPYLELPDYREIPKIFGYLDALADTRENEDISGFEVSVELGDLAMWVDAYAPSLKHLIEKELG